MSPTHSDLSEALFPSPVIISASRRTDIPAFYASWFWHSVQQGYAEVAHPFSHQKQQISLRPENVAAVVFWSKNFQPFLNILEKCAPIYNRRFLFHFTINGFSGRAKALLEPQVPNESITVKTASFLADHYGKASVLWRFDPLIFSNLTPLTEREAAFAQLAKLLHNSVERCYISVLDLYRKVERRFQKPNVVQEFHLFLPPEKEIIAMAKRLNAIAQDYGIQLYTCCENSLAAQAGLTTGHCVDRDLLQQLYPAIQFTAKLHPTRPECGCYYSVDIGSYNTCRHHCLYCYANN